MGILEICVIVAWIMLSFFVGVTVSWNIMQMIDEGHYGFLGKVVVIAIGMALTALAPIYLIVMGIILHLDESY